MLAECWKDALFLGIFPLHIWLLPLSPDIRQQPSSSPSLETSALFRNFTIRYVPSHRKESCLPSKTFKLAGSGKDWCVPLKRFNSLKFILKTVHLLPLHHQRKPISFYALVVTLHHKPSIRVFNFTNLVGCFVLLLFKEYFGTFNTYILFGA